MNALNKLGKGIDWMTGAYCYLGMIVAFVMGLFLAFESIASKFGFSTVWIMWGCIQIMAILPFATTAYAMRQYQHVRVSFFEGLMPPRTAVYSQIFAWTVFFMFSIICTFYLFWFTWDTFKAGESAGQINVPMWPFLFSAAFGMLLLVFQTARSTLLLRLKFTPDLAGHKTFFGSPVFILGLYIAAIVLTVWYFTINPVIGVFLMLIAFLFTGIPVAAAIGGLTIVALFTFGGFPMLNSIGMNLYKTMEEFTWFAFPLFVIGGFMMQRGTAAGLFKVMNAWIGWIPGGVAVAVIWTGVLLGAMLGSVFATMALLIILGLGELDKAGYPRSITLPMLGSASILGYLIPPSITFVVLGGLTDNSIGALFMAGIGPGLTVATIFSIFMLFYGFTHPKLARYHSTWKEKFTTIPPNLVALSIPILIIGTISTGFLTPTEAAAVAMVYIWVVNLVRREMKFSIADFKWIFNEGANVIGFMSFIIIGALLSKLALMHYHVGDAIVSLVDAGGVSVHTLMLIVTFILFCTGCIGESLPIIIVMIPTIFPVLYSMGIHPWWICVYIVLMGAIGGLTPPVGGTVFVISGMTNTPVNQLFRWIVPWVLLFFVVIIILYIFQDLVTYIPIAMGFSQPPGFGG
ncbi:MAG: TRAP transporter large permease subunit [Deltaproteobacteria bacterium]|nr:TRAP transporter large permease subunit [Deltaproteobacteria bacterium]